MEYLRVREIGIDVIPDGEPFIRLSIDKLIADQDGNIIQTIGQYDRIWKKFSEIPLLAVGTVADDGLIDPYELYSMLASVSYTWIMEKHGGQMINGKLVLIE